MNFSEIESRIEPLLRATPPQDARWLRALFLASDSHEAFTALDNELFIREAERAGPVLVASATRGEGRTTFALLLAVMTSALEPGRRVLLVDADIDSGRLAQILGVHGARCGLGEFFDAGTRIDDCIHPTALPNLFLVPLTCGSTAPIRLSPGRFREFVDEIRGRYDLVIVDSPAGGPNKAILSMASVVRNTLLVVKYGGPTREQVTKLLNDLKRAGADILGCVLNQREYVVPRALYGRR